jgi:hypothetical protein
MKKKDTSSLGLYKKVRKPKCRPSIIFKDKKKVVKKYDWRKDKDV